MRGHVGLAPYTGEVSEFHAGSFHCGGEYRGSAEATGARRLRPRAGSFFIPALMMRAGALPMCTPEMRRSRTRLASASSTEERANSRTAAPSQNAAMARSRVSRTFPTLPPSAISASAMTLAEDRDADVFEGSGDRGVRLMDDDADGRDLSEAVEHGVGDGAG